MRTSTIDERFSQFVENPTTELLAAVRELVVTGSEYQPYSSLWSDLSNAFDSEDFASVLDLADQLGPTSCLAPRLHFFIGVAALKTGDRTRAVQERRAYQACMNALLESGDGTFAAPYRVSYPSDSHELLAELGVVPSRQLLVECGESCVELIVGSSGGG